MVANARKLRAIYQNDRTCDMLDARILAKIARVDPELLSPIQHGSEERQLHRLSITLRDSLVKQRVNIISTIRFSLKSLGMRLPGCATSSFTNVCRKELTGSPLLDGVSGSLEALDGLDEQIKRWDKRIELIAAQFYPQTMLI